MDITPNPELHKEEKVAITDDNWEKIWEMLERGELKAEEFTIAALFDLASRLAVTGNYGAKKKIYEDCIQTHLEATDVDKFRVSVYLIDLVRREGKPQEAYDRLTQLTIPDDPIAKLEYLQAIGECQLRTGRVEESITAAREAFALSKQHEPLHRQQERVEAFLGRKLAGGQVDDEMAECFTFYEQEILDNPQLSREHSIRAKEAYLRARGRERAIAGRLDEAAKSFLAGFYVCVPPRERAVAAMEYLHVTLQRNGGDFFTDQLAGYFKSHKDALLPTDIQALQKKYDFVMEKLGLGRVE